MTAEDARRVANRTTTLSDLLAQCREMTGSDNLFVVSHDLKSLHRLDSHDETLSNPGLLNTLLTGEPAIFNGDTYIAFPDHSFPLLVARNPSTQPSTSVHAAMAGTALSHNRLVFDKIEQLRRPDNMSVAAQLQWDQLPVRCALLDTFHIAATLEPAASVAGDMYDIAMTPSGVATMLSMDAMGHGVSATLAASLALAAIRNTRRAGGSMAAQAEAADRALIEEYDGDIFVTMALIELTPDRIAVVNAGHEPARLGSTTEGFATLDIPADPPLGLDGPTSYHVHTLGPLLSGQRLCLLSDGASESRNQRGDFLGDEGVNATLLRYASTHPLLAAHKIGQSVLDYCGELNDDLTVMIACTSP